MASKAVQPTENDTVIYKEVTILKPGIPTVMIAGRRGSGRRTALSNIFHLKLDALASALSVTRVINAFEVIKKVPRKMGNTSDVIIQIVDTTGLECVDNCRGKYLDELKRVINRVNFTLLYCFSIAPNNLLLEIDKTTFTNLHHAFGSECGVNVCCCSLLVIMSIRGLRILRMSTFISLMVEPKFLISYSGTSPGKAVSRAFLNMHPQTCYHEMNIHQKSLLFLWRERLHQAAIFYLARLNLGRIGRMWCL